MNGLDQKLNKFYMRGFYLSWKCNQEEHKKHIKVFPLL